MNKNFKILALTLAIGCSIVTVKAQIASPDIFLGFRASGGTGSSISAVIDLGKAASIASEGNFTIDLSAANSFLSTTYGSSWYSRNDLYWGVLGSDDATVDAWIGRQTNTASSAINTAGLATINGNYDGMLVAQGTGAAVLGSINDTNSVAHITSTVGTSVSGSWYNGVTGSGSSTGWGYFPANADNLVTLGMKVAHYSSDYSGSGIGYTPVDLFTVANTSGVISIAVAAVPEPSTYVLLSLGLVGLVIVYRRKLTV